MFGASSRKNPRIHAPSTAAATCSVAMAPPPQPWPTSCGWTPEPSAARPVYHLNASTKRGSSTSVWPFSSKGRQPVAYANAPIRANSGARAKPYTSGLMAATCLSLSAKLFQSSDSSG